MKKHPLLEKIAQRTTHNRLTVDCVVDSQKFTLRSLIPIDEDWVLLRTPPTQGHAQLAILQIKPRIARALVAIDGTPVEELFPLPEDMSPTVRERLIKDDKALVDWRSEQVFEFIQDSMDPAVVMTIFVDGIKQLDDKKGELIESMRNLSQGTPSSG